MRELIDKNTLGLGTWIASGSATVTEAISYLGLDWLLFDLEHGAMTQHDLLENLRATQGRVKVIVRIGEFSKSLISRSLDWGADGIMMPHVNNARDARKVIDMMSYPPHGERGYSSSCRSYGYGTFPPKGIKEYTHPLFIAQIETIEGVQNVEEIAETEGVDMLFVGQSDLTLDLSVSQNKSVFSVQDALSKVVSVAKQNSLMAGTLVRDMEQILSLKSIGYDSLAITSDLGVIRSGYIDIINRIKRL